MADDVEALVQNLEKQIDALKERVEEIGEAAPDDSLAIGVISGSLDRIIATFIVALGAAAYDMDVHLFFTFWSIAALRDPKKTAKKSFLGKMFGWMLPRGSKKLPLSSMNMGGMGPKMIRGLMKKNGVASLEEMIQQAGEFGVKIYICEMSMDLMGFKREEMIDYPGLEYVGVGTFLGLAQSAKQTFFL
ncbi:MAG: DsrE/DsrF/DrsH-like family protein [Deltaproteobacteria bacterium]|nr:DsrE/DsrF/DrsH-like family protein [Deltaproteobacteria bacterium]